MTDKFKNSRKLVEAYDKLRAELGDALPLDSQDGRIDSLAKAIFELIEATIASS